MNKECGRRFQKRLRLTSAPTRYARRRPDESVRCRLRSVRCRFPSLVLVEDEENYAGFEEKAHDQVGRFSVPKVVAQGAPTRRS
mmetsp:Transcript_6851/g.13949  ORF Transcript_6851/g.13949 Transcript_6851/m.13949 type:complete len:84 (-) Transcript_6851:15-266(-)